MSTSAYPILNNLQDEIDWFYFWRGEQHGPVTTDALRSLIQAGGITPYTLVWKRGLGEWVPAVEAGISVEYVSVTPFIPRYAAIFIITVLVLLVLGFLGPLIAFLFSNP